MKNIFYIFISKFNMDKVTPFSDDFVDVVDKYIRSHPISSWDGSYKIPSEVQMPYQWLIYWAFCARSKCKISIWKVKEREIEESGDDSHEYEDFAQMTMFIKTGTQGVVIEYEVYNDKTKVMYNFDGIEGCIYEVFSQVNQNYNTTVFRNNYYFPAKTKYSTDYPQSGFKQQSNKNEIVTNYCRRIFNRENVDVYCRLKLDKITPVFVEISCGVKTDNMNDTEINKSIICDVINLSETLILFIHGLSIVNENCIYIYATLCYNETFYAEHGNGYYLSRLNNIRHYSTAELNKWTREWRIKRTGDVYNNLKIKLSQRIRNPENHQFTNVDKDYIFNETVNCLKVENLSYADVV